MTDHPLEIVMKPLEKDAVFILENIYYEYDKSDILPESAEELDRLYHIMQLHPNMTIELSSHTDSRGNDQYNAKLSNLRATSATRYLLEKGISPKRIQSKGYGESRLVNHCKNGVHVQKKNTKKLDEQR